MFTIELSWTPLFNFKHTSVRHPYTARLDLTLVCKCQTRGLGRSDLSYFPRCPSFVEHFCLQYLQVLSVPGELHFWQQQEQKPWGLVGHLCRLSILPQSTASCHSSPTGAWVTNTHSTASLPLLPPHLGGPAPTPHTGPQTLWSAHRDFKGRRGIHMNR